MDGPVGPPGLMVRNQTFITVYLYLPAVFLFFLLRAYSRDDQDLLAM